MGCYSWRLLWWHLTRVVVVVDGLGGLICWGWRGQGAVVLGRWGRFWEAVVITVIWKDCIFAMHLQMYKKSVSKNWGMRRGEPLNYILYLLEIKILKKRFSYLHMFLKTRGMSVRLITSSNFAIVGLVTRVYMTVFFPVTRIGKSSIASLKFAAEWFLSCKKTIETLLSWTSSTCFWNFCCSDLSWGQLAKLIKEFERKQFKVCF